jgi:hypothetical protein
MRLENRFLKTFREKETGHTGHLGKLRSELPSAGNTKDHVNGQMDTACGKHGKKRNEYRILVRIPEEKWQLRRPRRTREHNIKRDLRGKKLSGLQ